MAEPIHGAQVVSRVGRILRSLGQGGAAGLSSTALAHATGLPRPTVHRLLSSLAVEGFVDHDPAAGRWLLGPELYLLGGQAAARYDISTLALPSVRRLADETGESAFLSVRRGNETVCLLREEGSFPLRSFVLYEGVRFPLGVASAGLAILSYLGDDDVTDYLADDRLTARYGPQHADAEVRARIELTRQNGYALNPGLILEGSWGMGAAVFDQRGAPAWALSLTGIESRFRPERQQELGELLMHEAHVVTRRLHAVAARAGSS